MFKNICARAIIPVALTVTGFVVVCCILLYGAIKRQMITDAVRQSTALADTISKSTRYAMLRSDWQSLANIVQNVGAQKGVEHVRIFDSEGLILFSKHPEEIHRQVDKHSPGCVGCHAGPVPRATLQQMQQARTFVNDHQVRVLAITAPIANEQACYAAACHFHSAGQKLLGILDIGLDRAPLDRTLSALRGQLLLFSLMVLVLTVGGVAALLHRNVFLPIRRLADFTDRAADGNLSEEIPENCGELQRIGTNFREIVLRCRRATARPGLQPEREMTDDDAAQAPAPPRPPAERTPGPGNPAEDP